jgi:hypothetical protein
MDRNPKSEYRIPRFMQERYNPVKETKLAKPGQPKVKHRGSVDQLREQLPIEPKSKRKHVKHGERKPSTPILGASSHKKPMREAVKRTLRGYVIDQGEIRVSLNTWKKDHPNPKLTIGSKNMAGCPICLVNVLERDLEQHFSEKHPGQPVRSLRPKPKLRETKSKGGRSSSVWNDPIVKSMVSGGLPSLGKRH